MPRSSAIPSELTRGPFTIADAERAGLTRRQLRGASWRRLGAGVYVWTGLHDGPMLAVAAMHRRLPTGAAFSGRTAAWLHGLDLTPDDLIDVTVPAPSRAWARSGASVRRARLDGDVVTCRGMPVTSPVRTVADLAIELPLVEAVVVADMALHKRLIDLAELRTYPAAHPRRPGIARLRHVADLAEPATESPVETRLRMLLVEAGLPRPLAQVPLYDTAGRFLGRPDLY